MRKATLRRVFIALFTWMFSWTLGALFGLGLHNMGVDTLLCGVLGATFVVVYGSMVGIRIALDKIVELLGNAR